ncbi:MAG: hypothetical protein LWW83_06185 [Azonexaceae bacterium]|nr:hypothetical protein [Azonexaceae bacterium]
MRTLIFLTVSAGLFGCATSINQKNADRYYEAGLQAESRGNWSQAREMYSRALVNARSGGAAPEYVSAVTYNLGRATGYTCDFDRAESLLREALELEQALPKPSASNITKRWSELARLNFDQGKYEASARWYSLAVPELERMGILTIDPIGFAGYLGEQADSEEKSGRLQQAVAIRQRAAAIREASAGRSAKYVPIHFRQICSGRK